MNDALARIHLATIIHLIVVIAITIVYVVNDGNLPDDTAQYAAIVLGGNGLLSIGRGLNNR